MRLVHCVDKVGTEVCHWRISNGHQCRAPYMQQDCAATCGVCGMLVTQQIIYSNVIITFAYLQAPCTLMRSSFEKA